MTMVPWYRMAMLAVRGGTCIEVVYHHHNVDIIVAHLGTPTGAPYRVMFFDYGQMDMVLHHVGPCPAFQTGPNVNASLDTVEFSALGLLSALPRLNDACLYEICPTGYLCIDPSELRPSEDWIAFQPYECAVSRLHSFELCIWFIWTSRANQSTATACLPPGCNVVYSNGGYGGSGAVTVVQLPAHMWPGNIMTFRCMSSSCRFRQCFFRTA